MDKIFLNNVENFIMEIPHYEKETPVDSIVSENFFVGLLVEKSGEKEIPLGLFSGRDLKKYNHFGAKKIPLDLLLPFIKVDKSMAPLDLVDRFNETDTEWAAICDGGDVIGFVYEKQLLQTLHRIFYEDQKELRSMKKSLEHKDDYVAILAHEIRTPLSIISICCDFLETSQSEEMFTKEELTGFLDKIKINTSKATALVGNILELSSGNSGKRIEFERMSIPNFVNYMREQLELLAKEKGIEIVSDSPDDLYADINQMRYTQIIENIVNNAVKYSPENSKIHMTSRKLTIDGKNWIRLSIRDEGPGIPEDKMNTVFKKFQQTGQDTEAEASGVGLGLAIAKQFVSHHKGYISVENHPDGGAVFNVDIPEANTPEKHGINLQKRILVVDDEDSIRSYMEDVLVEAGYDVVQASNGVEGLNYFRIFPFDLVISDIKMPQADGFELLQNVKSLRPDTKFALVSGYYPAIDSDIDNCSIKADKFIKKPFTRKNQLPRLEDVV